MFKILCSNYKGLTYEKKINVNRGGVVFASSFPMIAASCENKNPTDESIINNTTPQIQGNQNQENLNGSGNSSSNTTPQTQDKQKPEDKSKEENPSDSDSSSSNTAPQTQGNQNQENPNGTGNSSTDTTPQIQGNQNQENLNGSGNSSSNTTPQTQDKQKPEDKSKEENPSDSDSSSSNTTPQTQGNQNQENPNGSGNSSTDTTPQTQGNQKPEDKSKKEEQKEDPEYLLKQLEEIQKDYEKAKVRDEEFKKLNYSEELEQWFGNISIPGISHKWNYYLNFQSIVKNKKNDEQWFKSTKKFIEKYKTRIMKDLKNLIE